MRKPQPDKPVPADIDAISPEELMRDFRGRPLVRILIVTVFAHVLFIGVFSFGYVKRQVLGQEQAVAGQDNADLDQAERIKRATREGETALREIADRHGVSYSQLSASFADPSGPSNAKPSDQANPPIENNLPAQPGSDYQKDLERQLKPPADPDLTDDIEKEDPIFPE